MAIETDFSFAQVIPRVGAPEAVEAFTAFDLLGPLRPMVGPKPADPTQDAKRKWKGNGFNLIWRPNFNHEFGQKQFFLQLNLTDEELDFTEITGTGIANRSLFEDTITLGGIAYTQAIKDSYDQSGQHFEPGIWANVPQTANPEVPSTIVRMGSIPHGTTINLQGTATHSVATTPTFDPVSITPFLIGMPDRPVPQPVEEDLNRDSPSRTEKKRLATLTPDHLTNPNLFLSDALVKQTVLSTTVLRLTSDASPVGSVPDVGGGTANIAFLTGKGTPPTGGPNAAAPLVTATFWIEQVRDEHGAEFAQMQYTQLVLLNFAGRSWPHITVATLRPVCAPSRDPCNDGTAS